MERKASKLKVTDRPIVLLVQPVPPYRWEVELPEGVEIEEDFTYPDENNIAPDGSVCVPGRAYRRLTLKFTKAGKYRVVFDKVFFDGSKSGLSGDSTEVFKYHVGVK